MHDFAVALNALDPSASDLILDLGTGSGWTSEWLARVNLRVVSMDIALDMLKIGQARCGDRNVGFAAGDFEALPFRSGSFDRALCLNALHHAPKPGQALREIARVLNDRGLLVLIEPGHGHAQRDTSQAAMSEFGVLEQDLEATMLMACATRRVCTLTVRPLLQSGEMTSRWTASMATWTRTIALGGDASPGRAERNAPDCRGAAVRGRHVDVDLPRADAPHRRACAGVRGQSATPAAPRSVRESICRQRSATARRRLRWTSQYSQCRKPHVARRQPGGPGAPRRAAAGRRAAVAGEGSPSHTSATRRSTRRPLRRPGRSPAARRERAALLEVRSRRRGSHVVRDEGSTALVVAIQAGGSPPG